MDEAGSSTGVTTLVLDPPRATDLLSSSESGQNVLAVLADQSADEWRRQWQREVGWEPAQTGIVETYDLLRGTTTPEPETTVVNPDLAVTQIAAPVEGAELFGAVREYLDGWEESQSSTLVYLDSLAAISDDVGEGLVSRLADTLDQAAEIEADVCARLDPERVSPSTVTATTALFERVEGAPVVDADALSAVERLRAADPTNFGYVRRHWREAMTGIESVDRTYPQAKQIHATLDDPETTPRTLGAALKALESLGVLDLWGDTVGANRYDLRSYDPDRLAAVGFALDRFDD